MGDRTLFGTDSSSALPCHTSSAPDTAFSHSFSLSIGLPTTIIIRPRTGGLPRRRLWALQNVALLVRYGSWIIINVMFCFAHEYEDKRWNHDDRPVFVLRHTRHMSDFKPGQYYIHIQCIFRCLTSLKREKKKSWLTDRSLSAGMNRSDEFNINRTAKK